MSYYFYKTTQTEVGVSYSSVLTLCPGRCPVFSWAFGPIIHETPTHVSPAQDWQDPHKLRTQSTDIRAGIHTVYRLHLPVVLKLGLSFSSAADIRGSPHSHSTCSAPCLRAWEALSERVMIIHQRANSAEEQQHVTYLTSSTFHVQTPFSPLTDLFALAAHKRASEVCDAWKLYSSWCNTNCRFPRDLRAPRGCCVERPPLSCITIAW